MNTVIAVLSTIILAVTILTLLLGIFAYIVYKTRKRAPQPRVQPEKPAEVRKEPTPPPVAKAAAAPSPSEVGWQEKETIQTPPSAEAATSLIRRFEPEEKKEKKVEWR